MSKILQVENLVQEFNLTKDFLDTEWFMRSSCGQQRQL